MKKWAKKTGVPPKIVWEKMCFSYDFRGYPCFFSPLFHRVRISSKTRAVCDPPIACVTVGSDPILTQAIGVPESLSPWEEIRARWSPRGILEGGPPITYYSRAG